jgi:Cu/Ag efflux pump CusA
VRRSAAALLSGIEVGSLFEDQKVFEVVVWGAPELRQDIDAVDELLIDAPDGEQVRLGDVATVEVAEAPALIQRDAVSRYIDVAATISGRDAASVVRDIESALAGVDFELEYRAEVIGAALERETAQIGLFGITAAAIVGIFLLIQAAVGSWSLAALTFLALPAATLGGIAAAWAAGQLLSLGALAGMLAVLGIAARNGLTLMTRYRRLERENGGHPSPEIALRGTHDRLAPTVMTAVVTGLAMVPFIIFGDLPGLEILRPMAIAIVGGLVSSTLLTLVVIPVLYLGSGPSSAAEREPIDLQAQRPGTQPMGV